MQRFAPLTWSNQMLCIRMGYGRPKKLGASPDKLSVFSVGHLIEKGMPRYVVVRENHCLPGKSFLIY
jgi:hypothetical protein